MQFRILGPLEIWQDGTQIRLRGRSTAKILATLLLEAGRVVPLSRLIEAGWDNDPPATARRQIQNTVAALRRVLAAVDTDPITATSAGYRIDPSHLDSRDFDDHLSAYRRHRNTGDLASAADTIRAALDLWRGPALAGIEGTVIEAGAGRLDEQRLAATEESLEVQLQLGRHHELIGELRQLLSANPYRQRIAAACMLALYRCGRTAEALAVFTDLRTRLASELGIDPCPPLRQLHEAILREDPDLDPAEAAVSETPAAPATPALPTPAPPAQLPADISRFTGRAEELRVLDKLVDNGGRAAVLSTVSGSGGAGKTALAVHWAYLRRDRFPDGQLYVNLRGYDTAEPMEPLAALNRFLRTLGHPSNAMPTDVDEASALYRSLVDGRRMLVLLDNACSAEQVRPLLPGAAGALALVTSRDRLLSLVALDDAVPVRLDNLTIDESIELLTELLGAERVARDPVSVRRLAELCDGLPLALRIAGARLTDGSPIEIQDYVDTLESFGRLESLAVDGDRSANVAASFDLSVRALDEATRSVFLRLGLVPGEDFSVELAEAVAGQPAAEVHKALSRLESACLLEQHHARRYRMHDLVRAYASRAAIRLYGEVEKESVATAIIEWFFARRLTPEPVEYGNVVSTLLANRGHPRLWRLGAALARFSAQGFNTTEVLKYVDMTAVSARVGGSAEAMAQVCGDRAYIHWTTGEPTQTVKWGRQAVRWARKTDDDTGVHTANLGLYLYSASRHDEAETHMTEGLRIAERTWVARHLQTRRANLGTLYRAMGRYAEAEPLLLKAVNPPDHEPLPARALTSRLSLGFLYLEMGRYGSAIEHLGMVRDMDPSLGLAREAMLARLMCARAYRFTGRGEAAETEMLKVLDYADRNAVMGQSHDVRCELAELYCERGDLVRAQRYLSETVRPGHNTRPFQLARGNYLNGLLCLAQRDYESALGFGTAACDMFAAMPQPRDHAEALLVVGGGAPAPAPTRPRRRRRVRQEGSTGDPSTVGFARVAASACDLAVTAVNAGRRNGIAANLRSAGTSPRLRWHRSVAGLRADGSRGARCRGAVLSR